MSWFKRLLLRWKSRHYDSSQHDDCLAFLGPCGECRDHMMGMGLRDPWEPQLPQAYLMKDTNHD